MPVINSAKVSAAAVFTYEMILEGFCAQCSIRCVTNTLSLNRHEVALLTDVITVVSIEQLVKRVITPLHQHLEVIPG